MDSGFLGVAERGLALALRRLLSRSRFDRLLQPHTRQVQSAFMRPSPCDHFHALIPMCARLDPQAYEVREGDGESGKRVAG